MCTLFYSFQTSLLTTVKPSDIACKKNNTVAHISHKSYLSTQPLLTHSLSVFDQAFGLPIFTSKIASTNITFSYTKHF